MKCIRIIQFVLYLVSFVILGYVMLSWFMSGVWGAPVTLIHKISLFASVGLMLGAIISLFDHVVGRIISLVAILIMSGFFIPALDELFLQNPVDVGFIPHTIIMIYFSILWFSLFYPSPWKFSAKVFGGILIVSLLVLTFRLLS